MKQKPEKIPIIEFRKYSYYGIDDLLIYICENSRFALSLKHISKRYNVTPNTIMNKLRHLKVEGFVEMKKINKAWYVIATKEGKAQK